MKSLRELADQDKTLRLGEFSSLCRALMLGRGSTANALGAAKGAPARVRELLEKAAVVPGGSGGAGTWADQLEAARLVLGGFSDSLKLTSGFAAALNAGLLVRIPIGDAIGLVASGVSAASEVGRSDPIPVHRLDVNNAELPRRKVAGMVCLSNEFLRQSPRSAESIISRELLASVGAGLDAAALATIAADVTAHTATGGGPLDDARMLMEEIGLGANSRPFWIAGISSAIRASTYHTNGLRHCPNVNPLGGEFLGFPLYVSAGAGADDLWLIDGARVAGNLDAAEPVYSNQALIEAESAPAGGVTGSPAAVVPLGATAQISLWQENASALKVTQYFGCAKLRSSACAGVFTGGSP
jgi:hypothetical protein